MIVVKGVRISTKVGFRTMEDKERKRFRVRFRTEEDIERKDSELGFRIEEDIERREIPSSGLEPWKTLRERDSEVRVPHFHNMVMA
jgi:hypothetical protein